MNIVAIRILFCPWLVMVICSLQGTIFNNNHIVTFNCISEVIRTPFKLKVLEVIHKIIACLLKRKYYTAMHIALLLASKTSIVQIAVLSQNKFAVIAFH